MFRNPKFSILLMACFNISALAQGESSLSIQVDGLRNGNGQLAISVFDKKKPEGFPDQGRSAVDTLVVPLEGKNEVHVRTKALPEGDYAIAILHDENSDNKFNTGFLGSPKEGFGFSNNPKVYFGPPSIEKALVHHSAGETEVRIRLIYF